MPHSASYRMQRNEEITPKKVYAPDQDCQNYTCGWASDRAVLCWGSQSCWSRSWCLDRRSSKTILWTTKRDNNSSD